MITNRLHKNNQLTPVDLLEDLVKVEKGRFFRALDEAMDEMKTSVVGTQEEIVDQMEKIRRSGVLIEFGIDEIMDSAFSLMRDSNHKRKSWEEYVNSARFVARPARDGLLSQTIGSVFHLEETVSHTASLVEKGVASLNDVQTALSEAKRFANHYGFAIEQAKRYDNKEKRICRKYASLKTWKRKDELERFNVTADAAVEGGIEVFIEGPLRLYLMITPEQFMFILRGIASANVFDFATAKNKGLEASLSSLLNMQIAIERSPLFKTLRTLSTKALRKWLSLWKQEQESIRAEMFTEEYAKRFVEMFEDGTLFAKQQ